MRSLILDLNFALLSKPSLRPVPVYVVGGGGEVPPDWQARWLSPFSWRLLLAAVANVNEALPGLHFKPESVSQLDD